ncbi:MAG TPA: type I-C CRISPR-associated protein Cas8c/Csd1, partial [Phycisphaerae bacterium]|nr:type I-C CRISPR-associated protein Cas8c/Csd1 [Phycisphaerae bacterium]
MILQELVKLCDSEELIPMPDFQWRQTHWHINIDANGKLLGPPVCVKEEIPVPNTNNRTITQGLDTILPWTIQPRTNEPESEFLCDNITYTFGFYSKEAKKLDKKMSLYQRYLIDALSATNDPGISAQLKCINMIRTKPQMLFNYWGDFSQKGKKAKDAEGNSIFLPKEWEDTDVFVFKFENKLVVHRQPVIDYWQRLRQNRREELPKGQCLISGKIAALALKHMQVKLGTASADPKGCSVVSFNNNAFTSYGLKKNANAQISQENMEKYAVALQMLLSPVGGKSKNVKCAVHNYLLSKEIRAVFWVDYPKKDSTITEILQGCFHGNISVIKELLDSPHTGKQIEINNAVNFLCFTMAAAKSRVIILSDLKTTLPKLQQALLAYYNDIELHTNEHEPSLCLKNILESAKP